MSQLTLLFPMMNPAHPHEIALPEPLLHRLVGEAVPFKVLWEIDHNHLEFGAHWHLHQGRTVYHEEGLRVIADKLDALGYPLAARRVRDELRLQAEAKAASERPWWQEGSME